jgi:hypothetical protein
MRIRDIMETVIDIREHLHIEIDLFRGKTWTIRDTISICQRNIEAKNEATNRELQARLEVVEARAERGREEVCVHRTQPPIYDRTTT